MTLRHVRTPFPVWSRLYYLPPSDVENVQKENDNVSCRLCQNCGDPSCGLQQHKVNFAVLQTSCHACENEELNKDSICCKCCVRCDICSQMQKWKFVRPPCPKTCGQRELIFPGERAAEEFCSYVTQPFLDWFKFLPMKLAKIPIHSV
jgi:hypothetical protein